MAHEIAHATQLQAWLAAGHSLNCVRLQDVDLTGACEDALRSYPHRFDGLVVLGGKVSSAFAAQLTRRGAVVFPAHPDAPVNPYRNRLYGADELYADLAAGYGETPDARAYVWSQDARLAHDAYATALRALHDDAIRDALMETLPQQHCVGVMGGHAWKRDSSAYADVARGAQRLAQAGRTVITGGGPGAMEAANLGAAAGSCDLSAALATLAAVPDFTDVTAWAEAGFAAREHLPQRSASTTVRSVGVPTWFYGHEPPNVFGDVIAKYFSNAVREDDLLNASREALIVLPGAAGTVQEIFQAVTPMYYAAADVPLPMVVLVGRQQWTETVPVWGALTALATGRRMSDRLHLVDSMDDAVDLTLTSSA